MLSSLKRLTKHSSVYGIGHIVSRLVNVMLLPLYTNTNVLSQEDFGATQIVYPFIGVMTIIYTFGIDAAFLRYFIMSDDPDKRRRVFSTAFWSVVVGVSFFTACVYIFAEPIDAFWITGGNYARLFRYASFILAFDALAFLPFLFLRAEEKSMHYTTLKFMNVIINVLLNFYFILYRKMGADGMLLANLWASGLTFGMVLNILLKQVSFLFDKIELNALLRFGLPFLPAALSVVLLDLIDRPIIERFAGLEANGLYSANAKLGVFMALVVTAFRFAWHPFFLSTSKQENAKQIFSKVLTYFTLVIGTVFLAVSLFIEDIVRITSLVGPDYWSGLNVVPPILLSYVFYGIYVNFMVGIYLKEKTKYLPMITVSGMVVNIVCNMLLIPRIGIMGAAWARLAGHILMCAMLYFFARRFYAIKYEFGRLFKLALVIGALFYPGYFTWHTNVIAKSLLLLSMPLLLYILGFFEKRELETLKSVIPQFTNRREA